MDRIPMTSRHRRVAAVVAAGTFFDAFDSLVLGVALTAISASLGQGLVGTGLLISAGYLGQFLGAVLIGPFADRYGRRRAFLFAITAFSILSVGCALAWSIEALTVARLLQGLGLGAETPVAAILISEYAPALRRGRAVMLYQAIFAWGVFAAPLAGLAVFAVVEPALAWRVLFALGVLPLLIVLLGRHVLPESARWLMSKGHVGRAEEIVVEFEEAAMKENKELPAPEERIEPEPGKPTRLTEIFSPTYRTRTILNGVLWFTTYFVTYGYSVWLPSLYVSIGGLKISEALYLTLAIAAAQLVVVYLFAISVDRIGRRPLLLAGYVVAAGGALLGVGLVQGGLTGWPTLFAAGLLIAMGCYVPAAGLFLYIPELYPTRIRGWGTSVGSSMNRLASVIAPTVVGALLAGGLGLGAVFVMFAVVLIVGLVAMARWGVETKARSLEETGGPTSQ
ncbi:MFS transporter [Pseudonocardia kujensis]|uniref:MFS transporter n=1 Tax=Pseudonocardia kujensis TaxID=1128675 RepID=UPI001E5802BC|nr:MFS transporter [Pseudonocardia kujensis]MCE0764170.1 MFS transporter [Pseudonocardia kujensis]